MKKKPLAAILAVCICQQLHAQRIIEDFQISLPEKKVAHSFYNEIGYLDSRFDTSHMGIVQLGAFNRKAMVVPKKHFSQQLPEVMQSMIDSAAEEGKLLFHLRKLIFAEITGAMSERGYCYLRADLYAKSNENYYKTGSIDTIVFVKSMDVTRALFRRTSKAIADFIAAGLEKRPDVTSTGYSLNDVQNMDYIEKKDIPLYNMATLAEGLYLSFNSFRQQTPDNQAEVTFKKGKISGVKVLGEDGKPEKVNTKEIYAVVKDGIPYVKTDYGFYKLDKKENDFYFIGKAKVTANAADVVTAQLFFGLIGGLLASNASASFEMKIDHLTGGFIRLREKAEPKEER